MYESLQICKLTSMHIIRYAIIQVYMYAGMQICKYANK